MLSLLPPLVKEQGEKRVLLGKKGGGRRGIDRGRAVSIGSVTKTIGGNINATLFFLFWMTFLVRKTGSIPTEEST